MAAKKIDFETVRKIAHTIGDVEDSTAYGTPALKIRGELLACIPNHKSAEPGSVAIRMDFADRDELLRAAPDTYYLKEHYVNYPVVLVRLARVDESILRDLLGMGWRFVTAKRARKKLRK